MPRTTIAPVQAASAAVALTATAADTVNQNRTPHTGRELIVARNSGAVGRTVTITSAPINGRLGNIAADALAAGATKVYGPFPTKGWRQTDNFLYFEANHAEVLFSVVRLPA